MKLGCVGLYVILATVLSVAWSATQVTPLEQCNGESFEHLRERVRLEPCGKTRCRLTKNKDISISIKFKPKQEVRTLTTVVYATVFGISLPFIGVTGKSACGHITRTDTGERVRCPLAPGVEYTYTNSIPIRQFYPSIRLRVHWSLEDGDKKIICFEVPAVIV